MICRFFIFKIIVICFACHIGSQVFCQQIGDSASYRFGYKLELKLDTLKNISKEDFLILQVGSKMSKSFSYYTFQSDSLHATPNGKEVFRKSLKNAIDEWRASGVRRRTPFTRGQSTIVYKNYTQGEVTITDQINTNHYIYTDIINSQTWQIIDSTKTILDYTCQMAVCDFRGRQWIAWFAHDIPISDGPWKFSGLPGLIMEVYDVRKHYHYTLVGMEQVEDEPIVFSPVVLSFGSYGKHEKTTRLEFLRGLARYQGNMGSIMNAELGQDTFDEGLFNARPYDLLERDYR